MSVDERGTRSESRVIVHAPTSHFVTIIIILPVCIGFCVETDNRPHICIGYYIYSGAASLFQYFTPRSDIELLHLVVLLNIKSAASHVTLGSVMTSRPAAMQDIVLTRRVTVVVFSARFNQFPRLDLLRNL